MTLSTAPQAADPLTEDGWFRTWRRVGWTDVDPSTNYQFTSALTYAEEAEIALLRAAGVLDELYPHLPRTHVSARFVSPAHWEDEVAVLVRVARIGRSSLEVEFRIEHEGLLCAEGVLGAALVDPDTGRSRRVPHHVRAALGLPAEEAGDGVH